MVIPSSKRVAPISGGRVVTGSVADVRWRSEAGILNHVPGKGIAVESAEEGDNVDWRKKEVVIGSYPARRAIGIWGTLSAVKRQP